MLVKSVILSSLAGLALSLPQTGKLTCGTEAPTKEFLEQSSFLRTAEQGLTSQGQMSMGAINVTVYYHVIAADKTKKGGYVSLNAVYDQHNVLNQAFSGTGIYFARRSIKYTINKDWANGKDLDVMKKTLRQGRYRDLNVYISPAPSNNPFVVGVCTLPEYGAVGSPTFNLDGCSVHHRALPGGDLTGYGLGMTAVHEVGHWFGLLHTFEGGCWSANDVVDDTPAQSEATIGCPKVAPDSCIGDEYPGLDPINNFMDYSTDICRNSFTVGQINRMKSFWNLWRKDM